ncbi:MAG: hypothetical protein J6X99_05705 [Bacteroidales bacterium]|nr:hypothetical protein [Bacteroidales bacterium]
MNVMVTDFSGTYGAQGFLGWLNNEADKPLIVDLKDVEGTCCYCDAAAAEHIGKALPIELPALRWIDSGDYHYMTHLLALREKEPFHLVLMDNHPDNQEPAFGGVLSCGSWVKEMQEHNGMLKSVLTIGPEGCPADIPEGWLEQRRGERVYVSLDKDIMDRSCSRTDWTQGSHTLEQMKDILSRLMDGTVVISAIDICGEMAPSKGATPEDLRINLETNIELYKHIIKHL